MAGSILSELRACEVLLEATLGGRNDFLRHDLTRRVKRGEISIVEAMLRSARWLDRVGIDSTAAE